MNDIPDWAGKRACELLNEGTYISEWRWPRDNKLGPVITVAKLVMQHEQPPVDPDEEAVKRVTNLACGRPADYAAYWDADNLARAVSQYKQEKGNG